MNVFIITKESFPNGMAAINRIKCLAKAIINQKVYCKIIVYNRSDLKGEVPYKGVSENIPYEYIGYSTKRIKGEYLGRIQSLCLQIALLFHLLFKLREGDFVIGYGRSNCKLRRIMIKVIHLRKAFYISELCELPYGTGKETNEAIKNRHYTYKYLFPAYDGVIAISDALIQLAKKYCKSNSVIEKVPILVDYKKYDLPEKSSFAEFPYIFHSGTLYEQKDGILGMIEAFGIATNKLNKRIHFVLTGSKEKSPHNKEIDKLIAKYELNGLIHFTGYLSNDDLRKKLSEAALVIINKYVTQQNIYCFSTKLGEYMAAGKPIIITRVGEAMNWVTDEKDCLIIEPGNTIQLADTIIKLFKKECDGKLLGENARKLCKNVFDYHHYGFLLVSMFNGIANKYK